MTFYIAVFSAVASALSLVLHALGAKYPKAEQAAEDVDKAEKVVAEIKAAVK